MKLLIILTILSGCALTDDDNSPNCYYKTRVNRGKYYADRICPTHIDVDADPFEGDTWRDAFL